MSQKTVLSLQYRIFKTQFESFHKHLRVLSSKIRCLDPLGSDREEIVINIMEKFGPNAAATTPTPYHSTIGCRLPTVISDVFELKLLELVDKRGYLSNTQTAKQAVKLCSGLARTAQHRSLVLALLSLSLPRQDRGKSAQDYVFSAFFVESGGLELLGGWLLAAATENKLSLSIYIANTLQKVINALKLLSNSSHTIHEVRAQLSKIKTAVSASLERDVQTERRQQKEKEQGQQTDRKVSAVNNWGPMIVASFSKPVLSGGFLAEQEEQRANHKQTLTALAKALDSNMKTSAQLSSSTTTGLTIPRDVVKRSIAEGPLLGKRPRDEQGSASLAKIISDVGMRGEKEKEKARLREEKEKKNEEREKEKNRQAALARSLRLSQPLVALGRDKSAHSSSSSTSSNLPVFMPFGAVQEEYYTKPSTGKKLKWLDEEKALPLVAVWEYELVLEELQAMGTFKARRHGYLIDTNTMAAAEEGDRDDLLSMDERRRKEHRLEKEDLLKKQRDAQELIRQQAGSMCCTVPWLTPSLSPVDALAADRAVESPVCESREKRMQTSRLAKKTAVVYAKESDLPLDPSPPAADTRTSSVQLEQPIRILWTDGAEMDISAAGGADNFLDLLPDYVHQLEEEQLERLMELLMSEDYSYLLEDTSSPGFLELVESVAPGIVWQQQKSQGYISMFQQPRYNHNQQQYNQYTSQSSNPQHERRLHDPYAGDPYRGF